MQPIFSWWYSRFQWGIETTYSKGTHLSFSLCGCECSSDLGHLLMVSDRDQKRSVIHSQLNSIWASQVTFERWYVCECTCVCMITFLLHLFHFWLFVYLGKSLNKRTHLVWARNRETVNYSPTLNMKLSACLWASQSREKLRANHFWICYQENCKAIAKSPHGFEGIIIIK